MKKIYIDFDSTLYNTGLLKEKFLLNLAKEICKNSNLKDTEKVFQQILCLKQDKKSNGILAICDVVSKKYGLEKIDLSDCFKSALKKGEQFCYDDSVDFLKSLTQKGYEINILTYTDKRDFDLQLLKLSKSGLASFVNNIIVCTANKGDLGLDYKNAIFIDDNPRDLTSLFNAGVAEERLFRVRRPGSKYSDVEINDFAPIECKSLKELNI